MYVFMGTFSNSTILERKRTSNELMVGVPSPWTSSGNVQGGSYDRFRMSSVIFG